MLKKAEAYIDTVITVFLGIVLLYVSMNVFSYFVQYQKLDNVADTAIRYATIHGDISSVELNDKIEDALRSVGFNPEEVTVSFDGSDFIPVEEGEPSRIQYGDKIQITLITQHNMAFIGDSGGFTFDISCTKINAGEMFYKDLEEDSAIHNSREKGDANGDGAINELDLTILNAYLSGKQQTIESNAADMNDDGVINNSDYTLLQSYLSVL